MTTGFDTQVGGGTYRLQFETDKEDLYQTMQAAARWCLDGKPESDLSGLISVADCPCDGCKQPCPHPAKCVMFALWLNKEVDAAPVVRCKDCKHKDEHLSVCLEVRLYGKQIAIPIEPDGFCAYGERRNNDG